MGRLWELVEGLDVERAKAPNTPQKPVAAPTEILPNLANEEALYRLWWKTLPDKKLAREHDGHLAYWGRERGLTVEALAWLRGRVADLLA